jgi:hypothetical protein
MRGNQATIFQRLTTYLAISGVWVLGILTMPLWAAPVVIDTTGGFGFGSVAPFGDGFYAGEAYGQTFVPPASHSVLDSFSFWVWHAPDLDTRGDQQ